MAARYSVVYGLALSLAIAIVSYELYTAPIPPFSIGEPARHPIDAMLIAIVLGMVVRNAIGLSARFVPGVRYAVTDVRTTSKKLSRAPMSTMPSGMMLTTA